MAIKGTVSSSFSAWLRNKNKEQNKNRCRVVRQRQRAEVGFSHTFLDPHAPPARCLGLAAIVRYHAPFQSRRRENLLANKERI